MPDNSQTVLSGKNESETIMLNHRLSHQYHFVSVPKLSQMGILRI